MQHAIDCEQAGILYRGQRREGSGRHYILNDTYRKVILDLFSSGASKYTCTQLVNEIRKVRNDQVVCANTVWRYYTQVCRGKVVSRRTRTTGSTNVGSVWARDRLAFATQVKARLKAGEIQYGRKRAQNPTLKYVQSKGFATVEEYLRSLPQHDGVPLTSILWYDQHHHDVKLESLMDKVGLHPKNKEGEFDVNGEYDDINTMTCKQKGKYTRQAKGNFMVALTRTKDGTQEIPKRGIPWN